MIRRLFVALVTLVTVAFVLGAEPTPAHAAGDPALRWYTIHTKHFRITYHSGLEQVAEHVADVAEGIHDNMTVAVGWTPGEIAESRSSTSARAPTDRPARSLTTRSASS